MITKKEGKMYVLSDKKDFIILRKCKELNNRKLNKKDKEVVKLIKTQLKRDWRSPLIIFLNRLNNKYK